MEKASFSIDKYFFDKVIIDLTKRTSDKLSVKFDPSGVFNKKDSTYDLTFNFYAISSDDDNASPFVFMRCIGVFKFDNVTSLSEIPSYFYRNSIALLVPYLRAYV